MRHLPIVLLALASSDTFCRLRRRARRAMPFGRFAPFLALALLACRTELEKDPVDSGEIIVDTGDPCDVLTWYADADGDGYGIDDTLEDCEQPSGYAALSGDCDDEDDAINPGATELCDGIDNDCDGLIDTNLADTDLCTLEEAAIKLYGETDTDGAGGEVAGPGDVNGDGYDDVFIGAADHDAAGEDAGAAYLVYGPITESLELADADWIFDGEAELDNAGVSIAGGDVDGDGRPDLLVGAHWEQTGGYQAGAVYLWTSAQTETRVSLSDADVELTGEAEDDWAGNTAAIPGDVNGDGMAEVLVGASRADIGGKDSGAAYLLYGPVTTSDLADADARFGGTTEGDRVGSRVEGAGDLDGDGLVDLVIGATGVELGYGAAYVIYGGDHSGSIDLSDADARMMGEVAGDNTGRMVSGAGDMNGDGLDDIVVGAAYSDTGGEDAGSTYLIFGPANGIDALADAETILTGDAPGDTAGSHGADGVGDVNADGATDLVIGVNNDDTNADNAGSAYLILGPVSAMGIAAIGDVAAVKYLGDSPDEEAGVSIAGAGDTNADGFADILIGGPESFGKDEGVAYLVLGSGF